MTYERLIQIEFNHCDPAGIVFYPRFFEMYRAAIKNTWTVEEVDFATDVGDLNKKMTDAERHLVQRLIAFFATGDSIVANNLVLNLYKHINAPEARMYLSRQLYEEALHVQFYLTLLDTFHKLGLISKPLDMGQVVDQVPTGATGLAIAQVNAR